MAACLRFAISSNQLPCAALLCAYIGPLVHGRGLKRAVALVALEPVSRATHRPAPVALPWPCPWHRREPRGARDVAGAGGSAGPQGPAQPLSRGGFPGGGPLKASQVLLAGLGPGAGSQDGGHRGAAAGSGALLVETSSARRGSSGRRGSGARRYGALQPPLQRPRSQAGLGLGPGAWVARPLRRVAVSLERQRQRWEVDRGGLPGVPPRRPAGRVRAQLCEPRAPTGPSCVQHLLRWAHLLVPCSCWLCNLMRCAVLRYLWSR